jgi:glycosyltransferase involved in cell wall biosynthesis
MQEKKGKLLMISTDRKIFEEKSAVRLRQIEYAKKWEEVHIVVLTKGKKLQETVVASNCWAYPTNSLSKITAPFDASRLGRFIAGKRGITEITCQDAFLTAMAGLSVKKAYSIPLELQVHVDIGSPYFTYSVGNRIRKAMALSYLPQADKIRVVSKRIEKYLTGTLGIEAQKISIRPIFVDTEAVKRAPLVEGGDLHIKYPHFSKIVLMASRLEKEKNIPLALEAFKMVLSGLPKTGLVIVGEGSQKHVLMRAAKDLGIENSVVFEEWADRQKLFSYYKTADVFLNTSLFEGYGMTLVEAHAAGTKVVTTDVGVAHEIAGIKVSKAADSPTVAANIVEGLC